MLIIPVVTKDSTCSSCDDYLWPIITGNDCKSHFCLSLFWQVQVHFKTEKLNWWFLLIELISCWFGHFSKVMAKVLCHHRRKCKVFLMLSHCITYHPLYFRDMVTNRYETMWENWKEPVSWKTRDFLVMTCPFLLVRLPTKVRPISASLTTDTK